MWVVVTDYSLYNLLKLTLRESMKSETTQFGKA